jgi:hypothetical protein
MMGSCLYCGDGEWVPKMDDWRKLTDRIRRCGKFDAGSCWYPIGCVAISEEVEIC